MLLSIKNYLMNFLSFIKKTISKQLLSKSVGQCKLVKSYKRVIKKSNNKKNNSPKDLIKKKKTS